MSIIASKAFKSIPEQYIACEDWEFGWSLEDKAKVERLWAAGVSVPDIAEAVLRPTREVWVLLMDLLERGVLQDRPGGWEGIRYA